MRIAKPEIVVCSIRELETDYPKSFSKAIRDHVDINIHCEWWEIFDECAMRLSEDQIEEVFEDESGRPGLWDIDPMVFIDGIVSFDLRRPEIEFGNPRFSPEGLKWLFVLAGVDLRYFDIIDVCIVTDVSARSEATRVSCTVEYDLARELDIFQVDSDWPNLETQFASDNAIDAVLDEPLQSLALAFDEMVQVTGREMKEYYDEMVSDDAIKDRLYDDGTEFQIDGSVYSCAGFETIHVDLFPQEPTLWSKLKKVLFSITKRL